MIDQEHTLEEEIIDMAERVTFVEDGKTVKEAEEGIKMKVVLEKVDSEEMEIEDKVGLEEPKVKEDPEGLVGDEQVEVMVVMEMMKSQGNKSTPSTKME